MKRDITLLINKSEITAGTRGSSLGPEAIMTAARKKSSSYFSEYPIQYVDEFNFMLDNKIKYPFSKRIDGLLKIFRSTLNNIHEIFSNGRFPLIISADHGSAGGTIAGIKAFYPTKRLGVVWIDAHGDLHTPYTTPSGNMHGMPLAIALNDDNRQVGVNSFSDKGRCIWEELKSAGIKGPNINAKDLVFIGVRDTEKEEEAIIERLKIKNHTILEVREKGTDLIVDEINNQLKDCDIIYISFDVDSMDPLLTSHGTGTPVDNGLKPEEVKYFLTELAKNKKTVCIEFVEVNPCLDEKINKMAEVTFDLLQETTKSLEKK